MHTDFMLRCCKPSAATPTKGEGEVSRGGFQQHGLDRIHPGMPIFITPGAFLLPVLSSVFVTGFSHTDGKLQDGKLGLVCLWQKTRPGWGIIQMDGNSKYI